MRNIEFVKYDGAFPIYCMGNLTISVDGVSYTFRHAISISSCPNFDGDYNLLRDDEDTHWIINDYFLDDIPNYVISDKKNISFSLEEVEYIEQLINDNISCWHCGGCS